MKKYIALLLAFISGFVLLFPLLASPPIDYRKIIREQKEPAWQGVIEVWLCETFYPGSGSFYIWLRDSIKSFEKKNEGILIKLESVTPFVVEKALSSGEGLPDAVICGPGVIKNTGRLLPVSPGSAYKPFSDALVYLDSSCGMPIAAGGYTIIADKSLSEGFSGDISMLASEKTPALSCPQSEYISYSLGLVSMLEINYEDCAHFSKSIFRRSVSDAWADFVLDKKSVAYACTQKEVYRMRKLEAGGSAFPWQGLGLAGDFTDQLLAMYITDTKKHDSQSRADVLLSFGEFLQSEKIQAGLKDIGAFSINTALPLYDEGTVMRSIEDKLMSSDLTVPNMFSWSEQLKEIRSSEAGGADTADTIASLKAVLDKLRDLR